MESCDAGVPGVGGPLSPKPDEYAVLIAGGRGAGRDGVTLDEFCEIAIPPIANSIVFEGPTPNVWYTF